MCHGAMWTAFSRACPGGLLGFHQSLGYINVEAKFDVCAFPIVHVSDYNKVAWVLEAFLRRPFSDQKCFVNRSSLQGIYH